MRSKGVMIYTDKYKWFTADILYYTRIPKIPFEDQRKAYQKYTSAIRSSSRVGAI